MLSVDSKVIGIDIEHRLLHQGSASGVRQNKVHFMDYLIF